MFGHGRRSKTALKRSKATGVLLSLVLVFAACGSGGDGGTSAAAGGGGDAGGQQDAIVIGGILSLSGPYSGIGKESELAIKAFESTNPEVDGRPVRFDIRNDQSDPTTGASVAQELVNDDDIVAIIGPNVGAILTAAYPVLSEATKPVMIITPVPYPNHNEEPFLFGPNLAPIPLQAEDFRDYADDLGIEDLAVITNDDASGKASAPLYEALGLEVETVPLSVTDYTPVLTKLRDGGADGLLIIAGSGEAAGHVLRARQDIGWEVETFVPSSLFNRSFMDLAGDAAIGVRGFLQAAAVDPDKLEGEQADVARQVQEALEGVAAGEPVYFHANLPYTWDHAYSLVLALQEAGSTDGEALQSILQTQEFYGAGGLVQRSAGDHVGWQRESNMPAIIDEDGRIVLAADVGA